MFSKAMIGALCVAAATLAMAQNAAPAAERAHTDRTVRFKQIDKNNDGKLSLDEFQHRPSNQVPEPTVDAAELANRAKRFKAVDKNGDGFLTFEEFVALETVPVERALAK